MTTLSEEHKAIVSFWGKLEGVENDYLLVQVHGEDGFGTRKTLYSTDGALHWNLLDPVSAEQRTNCDKLRGLFVGTPSYEYNIKEDLPPEPEHAEAEAPEAPPVEADEEDEAKEEDEE
eukprot:350955_1